MNVLSASRSYVQCPSPLFLFIIPFFLFPTGTRLFFPGNFQCLLSLTSLTPFHLFLPLSFFISPYVCNMCAKNRWLFPLHYRQWDLIYDAHRVERPIKTLFTVKRQDHQKPCWCFNCCWHKCYEAMFTDAHEAVVSKQHKTTWNYFCEFMFSIPKLI